MLRRDYRDLAGGGLLVLAGLAITWHASQTLDFGTVRRMGPGMFPMSVGFILATFGVSIAIPAFFRAGTVESVEWRSGFAVLASVAAFALTIRPYGLIPAIILLILVSAIAEPKFRPVSLLAMCTLLPAMAYSIFTLGLGLPLVMFRSPF